METDLKKNFDKATSDFKKKTGFEGLSTLLLRTPWVRILLDHCEEDIHSIEVEISMPEENGVSFRNSSESFDKLLEHLQYLQRLRDVGFELSVIGTGCIYCASKELRETPEDNLFSTLVPPKND